jgi:GTP1/Obg family GTP-binding protein
MLETDAVALRKEVFAWYGGTAYAAQCFEVELVILLLHAHRLRKPASTPQQLDEIDLRLSKRTLGQLLNELKEHFDLHPQFKSLLNEYIGKRNYLAHRFFYDNARNLLSRTGCESMIAELKTIHATMKEADAVAQAVSGRLRNLLGISEEEMRKLVDEQLSRAAAGETDEKV